MRINPGGKLSINDIVGRDALVKFILERLAAQSLLLVAERRIGKTHVLEKLVAEPQNGWIMLKRDIEGIRTAVEFVQYVVSDISPHLSKITQFRDWLNTMAGEASGLQVGSIKLPNFPAASWKKILLDAIMHIQQSPDIKHIAFLWDEFPWMLQNIAANNPKDATELLDILRSIRQQNDKIRMIFTGSIGLHHVIRLLKTQGYNNAPVNDMFVVEVTPLAVVDGTDLAKKLLDNVGIVQNDDTLAACIAGEVDYIPYYIHHVLSDISKRVPDDIVVTNTEIKAMVDASIKSAQDSWGLTHFEERTRDYYGTKRNACLTILDAVASNDAGLDSQVAINAAKANVSEIAQQEWLELIRLLEKDHYLIRDKNSGKLCFKFTVVRRWWQWHRGISQTGASN